MTPLFFIKTLIAALRVLVSRRGSHQESILTGASVQDGFLSMSENEEKEFNIFYYLDETFAFYMYCHLS